MLEKYGRADTDKFVLWNMTTFKEIAAFIFCGCRWVDQDIVVSSPTPAHTNPDPAPKATTCYGGYRGVQVKSELIRLGKFFKCS